MPKYGDPPLNERMVHLLSLEIACLRAKARFAEVEEAERTVYWLLDRPTETTLAMLRAAKDDYANACAAFHRAFGVILEGSRVSGLDHVLQSGESDSSSDVPNK